MALMEVVHYGDPILRKKCKPVEDFKKLSGLIDDMFDTMYEENGIGLAANQVGVDLNLFIIDISDIEEEGESIHVFINGEIIESSGESWFEEGCLSIPDVRLDVKRPETITFKYQDESGHEYTKEISGLLARAIQHEVDHLNGVFIVDRVTSTTKMTVDKTLKAIKKDALSKVKYRKAFVL
ncbi:MAG: peptide deformylase [Candidatus Marinimicrobia bacterium]|nr:peptide deformylase [Candidatus Neomarinimicrobiota bacterium]MDD9887510.1 peptide deformylase [Candidatus Neomarinimicrobiota bacterium]MDD9930492.1 peptide deformylase [Candidatus Neomarinimicrobiota bacterium]|tara:strand:- start:643 stop:1185 length:543 start_codon:yes stop_codon:yes gene_type:complete